MGSCSSVQKCKNPSAVASRVKEKVLNGEKADIVLESNYSLKDSKFGSQTEVFFDSCAWIDSDCEDDFFSVNGADFTPSRGTTPNNNPTITLPRQSSEKSFTFDLRSDPSPTGRKRLSELFQRAADQMDTNEQSETNHTTDEDASKKTAPSRSHDTVRSLVLTPSRDPKHERKMKKTADCCLPSFRFSDKQQRSSSVDCRA